MPYDFSLDKRPKLKISDVIIGSDRARKDFSHLFDVKTSIESIGLLQPIGVQRIDFTTKWQLIFGETRLKAAMMIPAMNGEIAYTEHIDRNDLQMKEMELEENLKRANLTWSEQAFNNLQIDQLKRKLYGDQTKENPEGWSHKKTADISGVHRTSIVQQIGIARKMLERPELRKRVENLPMPVAVRVIKQIEDAERSERLVASGELQLTSELFHNNALDFLLLQAPDSISLILTDPPFGMETIESRKGDSFVTDAGKSSSYLAQLKPSDNSTLPFVLSLLESVLPECFRVLKPGSHFYMFFDGEMLGEIKSLVTKSGFTISWPILIWDKGRSTTIFRGSNYLSCYESILFAWKPPEPRRLQSSSSAILKFSPLHAVKKTHIFEKPLDLLCDLIKRSTNHGDLVCDPFAGSASTLDAARQCGRRAIGCELDRENFIKAQARLLASTYIPSTTK